MYNCQDEHPLANSPQLIKWFQLKQTQRPNKTYELFLFNVVRSLLSPGKDSARHWVQGLDTFLRTSLNPLDDYLTTDSLCQELGRPFTELLSILSETAIRGGEGHRIFTAVQNLASKTNLSALRFLSAWVALNLGDLQTCIEECEKEAEAHGPIHTLLGQALLESGRPNDAVDAFMVSLKLDPSDVLALFQLVKALLVLQRPAEAIPYAEQCSRLCTGNTEVECLAAMVVVADRAQNREFADLTLARLVSLFQNEPDNLDLLCLAFEVIEAKKDYAAAAAVIRDANFLGLAKSSNFTLQISRILRTLGDKGWYSVSQQLTEKMLGLGAVSHLAVRQ